MSRTLILTPYEHGFLAGLDHFYNKGLWSDEENQIDIPHVLLSALTMAGVDRIASMGNFTNSRTTLVKKITSPASTKKWSEVYQKAESIVAPYKTEAKDEKVRDELDAIKHKISQLLFSLKTNSGIITFSNYAEIKSQHTLPLELVIPLRVLLQNVQAKSANLPVLKYETDKKDVKRFLHILGSKEFKTYQEAQSEIEQAENLTTKTIKSIEKAGKDLYKKNVSQLDIRESIIKAIPLSSKVIELFFGKLPGIITDYTSSLLTGYLKLNKSIPIYNCEPIIDEIKMASLRLKVIRYLESKKGENSNPK